MTRLTGRTRLRLQRRWFRRPLLIPQVEIVATGPTARRTWWRDATVEDVTIRRTGQEKTR